MTLPPICSSLLFSFLSIVIVLARFSPFIADSYAFNKRFPRIGARLKMWGEQPLWVTIILIEVVTFTLGVIDDVSFIHVWPLLVIVLPFQLRCLYVAHREAKNPRVRTTLLDQFGTSHLSP